MHLAKLELVSARPIGAEPHAAGILDREGWRGVELEVRHGRGAPGALNRRGVTHFCVQAAELDEPARRLAAAGFKPIAPPVDLGGAIQYQYARDDDGAIVELESVPEPKRKDQAWLAHIAFASSDCVRLAEFYAKLTGSAARFGRRLGPWEKIDRLTGFANAEVSGSWVACGDVELEFWTYHVPGTVERPAEALGFGEIGFACADLAAEQARLAALGIDIDATGCGVDPDGNGFRFVAA